MKAALRAFKHRNYTLYFSGQLVSLIGTWMQMVAQSWLVYRLTDSTVLLGMVTFAGQFPGFIISPLGGVFADRHSRHRILIGTQVSAMILAFVLAALTLMGHIQVWEIIVLSTLSGVVNGFDIPTRQAFVVEMVGKEDMINAIALNSSMMTATRVIGPAVAGVLVGWIGEGWCFFLNGVSFFAVIAGLLMMKLPKHVRVKHDNSAWQHTVEGFKYVWQDKAIFILILMLGLMCMFAMPFSVLMPVIADKVLHGGPSAMGILMGMSAGGAFLGSLLLAGKKDSQGLERWIILGCIGCGFSLIAFALSTNLWLSAVLLVPVGLTMTTQMAASNTLIQMRVPDKLRGRVMSVFAMMFLGMSPFGSLLAGILAKPLGTPVTIALGGAACAIAGFACWKPARKVLLGPA